MRECLFYSFCQSVGFLSYILEIYHFNMVLLSYSFGKFL